MTDKIKVIIEYTETICGEYYDIPPHTMTFEASCHMKSEHTYNFFMEVMTAMGYTQPCIEEAIAGHGYVLGIVTEEEYFRRTGRSVHE